MGKLKKLETIFEHDKNHFLPGETVVGKVVLENAETFQVKGIRVKFKGRAEVTMFVGDYDTQKERYFSKDVVLLGHLPKEEGPLVEIPPGLHEYPFKVRLPSHLPNSFHCDGDENGSVVYFVEAIVHRPGKFSYSRRQEFIIHTVLDLNELPVARQAVENEGEKAVASLVCNSGTISAFISLPREGYVPGEAMSISGRVTNSSKRNIKRSFVVLEQVATLKVYGSAVTRTARICKGCERGSVPPGGTDQWSELPMEVPDVPPTYLRDCQLIDVRYVLKLIVVPSGLCSNLQVPVEVIIGTVAVRDSPQQDFKGTQEIRMVKIDENEEGSNDFEYGTPL
ncbi:arrestin domain-containing protein 4-like [Littorina saxatilis]|uniref:Arrestin C-terminal-like domain-containing protein n=1 Tax=Littorina saxatilis TaxID=31220 RepID=A0AAN9AHY3_9CAEN